MIAWGGEYTDRMSALRLLAIDTATDQMAVAVVAGERDFCAQEDGGARASQRLLPLVSPKAIEDDRPLMGRIRWSSSTR